MRQSQVLIHVKDLSLTEKSQILYNHIKLGTQTVDFKRRLQPHLPLISSSSSFLPETARRLGNPLFTNVRPWFVNDQQQHDLLVQHLLAYRKSGVETLPCEGCPRHVPDAISAVPAVPYTLTGKKLEVPVRRVLSGMRPEQVASRDVLADPTALDY